MLVAETVAAPLLVVFTSAMGVTVVMTLALEEEPSLFEVSGSLVVFVLETVLVNETPVLSAVMMTVKFVVAPTAKLVIVGHQTVPLPLVPLLVALTKVTFVGRRSLTMTLVAMSGPMFVTVMV